MAENWKKKGLLEKDTRWGDVDTTNTVFAGCYNLKKIHKENYPLRLFNSTNNTPTRSLEQNLNMTQKKLKVQLYC